MDYEVYLDLLFVFNLWMSWILLEVSCRILNRRILHRKLLAMAFLYSVGYCIVVCIPFGRIREKSILFQILPGILLYWKEIRIQREDSIKSILCYYLTAFGMMGFLEWMNISKKPWTVMLAGTAGAFLLMLLVRCYRALFMEEQYLYEVFLTCGGCQESIRGLLDSGNLLREPVSQCAVHIVTKDIARRLGLEKRKEKFRVIPYHSIGKSNGMIEGYFADYMVVKNGNRETRIENPCIGIYEGNLSGNGSYGILLNSQTFQ